MTAHPPRATPLMPSRESTLDAVVAVALAFAIGSQLRLTGPLSLALLAPLALAPVWMRSTPTSLRVVAAIGVAAIGNGLLLNEASAPMHVISGNQTRAQIAFVLEVAVAAGALYWVRKVVGAPAAGLSFGIGVLASQVLSGLNATNPWKFSLFLPVAVCCLSVAWWRRSFKLEVAVLLGLIGVSALNDSRSAASMAAMTLAIVVWQRFRTALERQSTPLRVALVLAIIATGSYFMMQAFILDGYLGQDALERSESQLRTSGSLLLGGRPEMGATFALLLEKPMGYGLGAVPNSRDVYVAKSGMASLHYEPNNGYVERYMFGNGFEVHSIIGDLWLRCGVFGLILVVAFLVVILGGVLSRVARNRASGLAVLIAILVIWEIFFGPFYPSTVRMIVLALAMLAPMADEPALGPPRRSLGDLTVRSAAAPA
ncbi:MAG: hypothetical protein QM708_11390 [Propioniciclava sp.]|uniref:O-antigen ligase family protein n=1 Tax=Propioniciclava sp. TaxID=2038686 RepID=UPI0039E3D4D7